jgi:hypothetical protein
MLDRNSGVMEYWEGERKDAFLTKNTPGEGKKGVF